MRRPVLGAVTDPSDLQALNGGLGRGIRQYAVLGIGQGATLGLSNMG